MIRCENHSRNEMCGECADLPEEPTAQDQLVGSIASHRAVYAGNAAECQRRWALALGDGSTKEMRDAWLRRRDEWEARLESVDSIIGSLRDAGVDVIEMARQVEAHYPGLWWMETLEPGGVAVLP